MRVAVEGAPKLAEPQAPAGRVAAVEAVAAPHRAGLGLARQGPRTRAEAAADIITPKTRPLPPRADRALSYLDIRTG